jgi:AraC family transcriptional regulator
MDITAIALEVGFAYPEVFSRAFKRYSGISPRNFRSAPPWDFLKQADAELSKIRTFAMSLQNPLYKVEIIQFAQLNVAILSHLGAPSGLGQSIQKFIAWRKVRQLPPGRARTFNIIYTPPQIIPAEEFRLDLAVEFALQSAEEGVQPGIIPGGLCACIAHQGDDTGLEAAVNYLYNQWLPAQTEYTLRDAPLFFERVVFYPDVPAHLAQTHIYLPLQKPADK